MLSMESDQARELLFKEINIDPSLLDAYVGRYQLQPGFIVEITKENGRLMAVTAGQPKIPLFPESATKFFFKVTDAQVTFQLDQKRLILHQGGADMPASKLEAPDLTPDQLNQYVGDYYSDELSATYQISLEGNQLYLKVEYNPKAVLSPVRQDEFSSRFAIFFQSNRKGEITGFEIDAGRVQNLKFIKR